jgi:hypothetical protein
VCFFRRCTWPRPTATASLCVRRAWYCAWPRCVCVSRYLCILCVCLPVRLCAALCRRGGHGPACVCLRPCVCVHLRLSSFSWHGRGPLYLSLSHALTHAVCGGAGGGINSQLGRLQHQQQRVHRVGEKGPLGAVRMRRLRHAWGGHSERERGARDAASGGRAACVFHGDQVQQCAANLPDEATEQWHRAPVWATPAP